MLDPEYEERVTGHAEVRQTFKHPVLVSSPVPMYWMVRLSATAKFVLPVRASRSSTVTGIFEEI